ncbi:MAG: S8 family peptidase [Cellvibrionaceae bacterium]|nr:S8 family peptidase [Cellvibrionaceae bacterium]
MPSLYKLVFLGLAAFNIVACGSDSNVDNDSGNNPISPPPTTVPTAEPAPPEPSAPPGPVSSVSGTVSIAANVLSDSDNNDPNNTLLSNSAISSAQRINNRSSVQGFLTLQGTGNRSDQLNTTPDVSDYYAVTLQEGQVVQMQVIDYSPFANGTTLSGDLDLELYDENAEAVAASIEVGEFEQVEAQEDGLYYIRAFAFAGSSKYVIRIIDQSTELSGYQKSLDFVPGQAIIKTQVQSQSLAKSSNLLPQQSQLSHSQSDRPVLATWPVEPVKQSSLGVQIALSDAAKISEQKLETLRKIKQIRLQAGTEYAEPNYIRQTLRQPNDNFFETQWHYTAMNLPQAWDISIGQPANGNVIVAVIDTGVFLAHAEIDDNLVQGYDFISSVEISGDGDGIDNDPDDPGDSETLSASSWHGTHVAGTIAAESDNDIGIAGVSWGAKIMPLRALGIGGGTSYDIQQALRYAAGLVNDSGTVPEQAADIINLSLGGEGFSSAEAELYSQIAEQGTIVVAAAGNSNTSRLFYPASYEGVISVAAVDAANNRAPYSNFGSEIDIAAPGGNNSADLTGDGRPDGILSLVASVNSDETLESSLAFYQGTSMAAPHVAGLFALMKAVYPALTAEDVRASLQAGFLTQDAGEPGRDNIFGYGIADALKAVQEAQRLDSGGEPPEAPPSLVATPSVVSLGSDSSATFSISNRGGGDPSVTAFESDVDWLSIAAAEVNDKGIGSYTITADRSDLVDSIYIATVTFNFDTAAPLRLQLSMRVGDTIDTSGNLSQMYVLLLQRNDEGDNTVVTTVEGTKNDDGSVSYQFDSVPAGNYLVFAGTDIDNDGFVCQAGEGCGSFPSPNESTEIVTDGENPVTVDFVASILAGFTSVASTSSSPTQAEGKPPFELRRLNHQNRNDDKKQLAKP